MIGYTPGQTLTFAEDPNQFTVQAVSESGRWVAATRGWTQWDIDRDVSNGDGEARDAGLLGGWPDLGECVYTVIDTCENLRGVDNAVGSLGYETPEQCVAALRDFELNRFEFSRRSRPIALRFAGNTQDGAA